MATEKSDHQLVELALAGDAAAYGELHQRYRQHVFQEILLMVKDWDIADSASQTTFVNAFDNLKKHRPDADFSKWLLRIAKNEALDRLSQRKKSGIEPIEGSSIEDTDRVRRFAALQVADRGATPLGEMEFQEDDARLQRAFAQLRPDYQTVVLLELDGVPQAEIASRLGIPLNTVRSHLRRARKDLKVLLKQVSQE